jgi:hypothetical protein
MELPKPPCQTSLHRSTESAYSNKSMATAFHMRGRVDSQTTQRFAKTVSRSLRAVQSEKVE